MGFTSIHPSYHVKVYQSLRSNRASLSHMFECKILSGLETLGGFVTSCWITGTAPPVLLWTAAWARLVAFHLRGNRSAQPIADTLMLKMVPFAQLHAMCYFCVWSVMVESGGHHHRYAELKFLFTTPTVVYVNWLFRNRFMHHIHTSTSFQTRCGHLRKLTPFCQAY